MYLHIKLNRYLSEIYTLAGTDHIIIYWMLVMEVGFEIFLKD